MANIFFHEVEVNDYPLFTYPPYALSLASKMVEVTLYENLEILHVHYAVPHATSAYLAKQVLGEKAPKVITTLHGTDITLVGNDRSYLPMTRFSIFQSDGVSAPSQYLKQATYDELNLSTSTAIEVIPNFVDTQNFKPGDPAARANLEPLIGACPVRRNIRIITHVSNFRPVKRLTDVVRVFEGILKEVHSHLVLIGDGPERSNVEHLVRDLGIAQNVCFLGKMENFVPILQHSDLFLLPSQMESFGLAALEAMSCGVPVIASNVQGIPEVVIHGKTGYLSKVGDVADMTAHALHLLKDQPLHQQFSQQARKRVLDFFNQDEIITQYERFYFHILDQPPRKPPSATAS